MFRARGAPAAPGARERVASDLAQLQPPYEEVGFIVFQLRDPDGYLLEVEASVPTSPPPA